jgi:hypothetical protein
MKTIKIFAIIGLVTLYSISSKAQVSLPYYSGFDNVAQNAGWIEYQKAEETFCHWGPGYAYSLPNGIGHGFAPSSGITLIDNWFVSPAFSIINGGKLDSIRYMFSGYSQPLSGDTIALYLLNGSQDPSLASSKILLFDFRNTEYIPDYTYRIKTSIILPSLNGSSYLAIRYRNSDCSHNWLTVNFDNIAISGNSVGVDELNPSVYKVNIYPNPAKNNLTIETNSNIKQSVEFYNFVGKLVYNAILCNNTTIDITNFQRGVYILKLKTNKETEVRRFVIEK